VTYRDDHDAAIARAESLEHELAKVEHERDRLQSRVHELEHEQQPDTTAAREPRGEPAVRRDRPLDDAELARLLAALENEVEASRIKSGLGALVAIVILMLLVFAVILIGQPLMALVFTALIVLVLVGRAAASTRAAPASWQPVVEAVREAPDRIISIEQHKPREGWGIWLTVRTADHALRVNTSRATELVALLARRCPSATFKDR
jgi:hypothetical protein